MILYGIPNCDTVKKARQWLSDFDHPYDFHDFKKQGLATETLQYWLKQVGWAALLNESGSTWRKLSPEQQASVVDNASAAELLINNLSAIKRPVLVINDRIVVGFKPAHYQALLDATPNSQPDSA
jgi:arsenate reductase